MGEREIDYLISKNVEKTMNQVQNEPYWTPLEREVLYEEVSKRIEVIDGKFKGASSGKAEKNRAWLEVTDVVNAKGTVKKRTVKQVKKQWSNMKQRAKKINSQTKYPGTGGGPKPPSPSPMDEAMLTFLAGKPSMDGIDGGLETACTATGDQPQLPESEEASCRTACTSTSVPVQQMADGNPPKRKRSRDISEIHLEVLEAEKDKLRLESDYIKLKMKKVSAELELIEMQKNFLRNGSLNYLSLSQFSEV
ncbi:myb/SANT-like DNA-binding domain-containing protein 4 [Magallana gigas]|uniref:myb/SANT-like DNA-binding domain-containing protein 4 n=1 Tax=Magallana gigas TaxID=29159 RepID=UPI00333F095F